MKKKRLHDYLNQWIVPIAEKLEAQKHLQAIKDGMVAVVPILIIGSFSLIPLALTNLISSGPVHDGLVNLLPILTFPEKFTSGLISLYAAYFIAYSLAKRYDLKNRSYIAMTAMLVHLILTTQFYEGSSFGELELGRVISTGYLGAEGLFTSMIAAILTVEITRFIFKHKLTIRLPESVPSMVASSFDSLIPMVVNVMIASGITLTIQNLSGGLLLPSLIIKVLGPALSSMDTLPAMLTIVFLTQLLWFFGLHGAAVTSAIWVPFAITYGSSNMAAVAAGQPAMHFFTFGFYYSMLQVTGSGLTLGLVILMMFSKSKTYSSIGKVSIIPSLFGINEPVIFGTPVMLNPYLFVPFVFGPLLITVISYCSMAFGIIGMPIAEPPSFMPPGLGAFLMTLDWKAVVVVIFNLLLMTAIYYPFFKAMEADELKQELTK